MKIEIIPQIVFILGMIILVVVLFKVARLLKFLIFYLKKPPVWVCSGVSAILILVALVLNIYRLVNISTRLMCAGPLDLFPLIKSYMQATLMMNGFIFIAGLLFFLGVYIFTIWIER